jgi:hypothetical protein
MRRELMLISMTRQEHHVHTSKLTTPQRCRRTSPWGLDRACLYRLQRGQLVEACAANDPDPTHSLLPSLEMLFYRLDRNASPWRKVEYFAKVLPILN